MSCVPEVRRYYPRSDSKYPVFSNRYSEFLQQIFEIFQEIFQDFSEIYHFAITPVQRTDVSVKFRRNSVKIRQKFAKSDVSLEI